MIAELKELGVTFANVLEWSGQLNQIMKRSNELQALEKKDKDEDEMERSMSSAAIRTMEALYRTLKNMLDDKGSNLDAYRMARTEEQVQRQGTRWASNPKSNYPCGVSVPPSSFPPWSPVFAPWC